MIYFKKCFQIFALCSSLFLSQVGWAVDVSSLSESELAVVKKLGISDEDLKALDTDTFKNTLKEKFENEKNAAKEVAQDKIQEAINSQVEPKINELKAKIEVEKAELKKDAQKLGAAYITSTISLFAAALIGPQVVMVCKTKPSAIVYAGTAAVYIIQEMRNVKILKASQLAEIEVVSSITIDKNKSLKENAKMLENTVDQQVGYLKAYKSTLDNTVTALKKKAKNAKMVSIGFLAASATAVVEQMDWISGGGTCVTTTSIEKINFGKELDQKYASLIEGARTTEDKWGYYYEWESMKFGVDRTLSANEYQKIKKIPVSDSLLINAMNFVSSNLLSSALAAEESKKITVDASLKDNKAADWMGDLDKLGIVGGLAINVVAYIAGWQMGFLKSIIASGTSRAVTFGVQGALAFTAGKLFEDAANDLGKKLEKVENLINSTQDIMKKGINYMVPSDSDARRFQSFVTKLGVPSDKLITDMTLIEAEEYLKQIKAKAEELNDEGKVLLKQFEDEIMQKIKQKLEEKKTEVKTSFFLLEILIPSAMAQSDNVPTVVTKIRDIDCVEKRTCPNMIFPKSNNPNTKILNQYLGFYERYYQGVKTNNPVLENASFEALEKNKNTIVNYRGAVFKKAQEKGNSKNTDYAQFERAKMAEEVNNFSKFYNSLPEKDKMEMNKLNPKSTAFVDSMNTGVTASKSGNKPKLTPEERKILEKLLDRLPASKAKKANGSGPDMSFVDRENKEEDYNFGNTSIHPKDSELFDIIHIRYLKFLKKNYPDL